MPIPDLTLIPAGTFTMGNNEGGSHEQPEHVVTITRDFLLGTKEVSNQEYQFALQWAFDHGYVTANSSTVQAHGEELIDLDSIGEIIFADGVFGLRESPSNEAQNAYPDGYDPSQHPVLYASWYGAACYCDWVSLMEGLPPFYDGDWSVNTGHNPYDSNSYTLPTEAQWEFANRYNDGRIYPWGDENPQSCYHANYQSCIGWTTSVGIHLSGNSTLGLSDMAGNVYEFMNDWFSSYSSSSQIDPIGPTSGNYRVMRSGYWADGGNNMRSTYRSTCGPDGGSFINGFRVCRTANP